MDIGRGLPAHVFPNGLFLQRLLGHDLGHLVDPADSATQQQRQTERRADSLQCFFRRVRFADAGIAFDRCLPKSLAHLGEDFSGGDRAEGLGCLLGELFQRGGEQRLEDGPGTRRGGFCQLANETTDQQVGCPLAYRFNEAGLDPCYVRGLWRESCLDAPFLGVLILRGAKSSSPGETPGDNGGRSRDPGSGETETGSDRDGDGRDEHLRTLRDGLEDWMLVDVGGGCHIRLLLPVLGVLRDFQAETADGIDATHRIDGAGHLPRHVERPQTTALYPGNRLTDQTPFRSLRQDFGTSRETGILR